jgi:hypothetical protein
MADKQRRAEEDREEEMRYGQRIAEDARAEKQRERDAKAARRASQAKELQALKEQFLLQQRARCCSVCLRAQACLRQPC